MQWADHREIEFNDFAAFEAQVVARLVRDACGGDVTAWHEILSRFGPMIVAVGTGNGLSSEEVDELQQRVWIRLVEGLDRIDPPERLRTWLSAKALVETRRMLKGVVL